MEYYRSTHLPIFNELEHVKILDWYDGPLAVLTYSKENNSHYLIKWADVDDKHNRWIIYGPLTNDQLDILKKSHTESNEFLLHFDQPMYFVTDDGEKAWEKIYVVPHIECLDYIPDMTNR